MKERIEKFKQYLNGNNINGLYVRDEALNLIAEIARLEAERERLKFDLQCEKDTYGSDVLNVLGAVQEGTMSKMAAHQRLNKVYKERYSQLKIDKEALELDVNELLSKINHLTMNHELQINQLRSVVSAAKAVDIDMIIQYLRGLRDMVHQEEMEYFTCYMRQLQKLRQALRALGEEDKAFEYPDVKGYPDIKNLEGE